MKKKSQSPSLVGEAIIVAIKLFFIFLVLNNVVWGVLYFKPSTPRVGDTHVEITQSGDKDVVKQSL